MAKAKKCFYICGLIALLLLLCSCGSTGGGSRANAPTVLSPRADGTVVYGNTAVTIDASHTSLGYAMVDYTGGNPKAKMQITGPDGGVYTYDLQVGYETFPLTAGSGTYTLVIYENAGGNEYTTAFTQSLDVTLEDAFSPFLYPNQYVWYTADSAVVPLSQQLGEGADTDLDVITQVYDYVTTTIQYDDALAQSVTSGYLPNLDTILETQKGICFDYAALMTALLRIQNLPTRLEIGYAGSAYHAWISVYTAEKGWVENVIEFDGSDWTLMDPTLAANNDNDSVKQYIGDGSRYVTKFRY